MGRIPKLWVAFLEGKMAISCIFRRTNGVSPPFVRRKMQEMAVFSPRKATHNLGMRPENVISTCLVYLLLDVWPLAELADLFPKEGRG
jgi:hypothetical protein